MEKKLFLVKDHKSIYSDVFTFDNEPTAIRWFKDLVKTPGSVYFNNPEDFSLWYVGLYDNSDAAFDMELDPICVSKGVDFKEVS